MKIEVGQAYIYRWGNHRKREQMKGRRCRVIARGKLNSCLVEFLDKGQQEIISRNALRKESKCKSTVS